MKQILTCSFLFHEVFIINEFKVRVFVCFFVFYWFNVSARIALDDIMQNYSAMFSNYCLHTKAYTDRFHVLFEHVLEGRVQLWILEY